MKQTVKVKSKEGDWKIFRVITYSSYTFNDVDPAVFAPPTAVRDLVAKSKTAPKP
jgi:methenyltetrahydromethanopterin cyclohydrolase